MNRLIKRLQARIMLTVCKRADQEQLGALVHNILHRYSQEYPNDEFVFLTLPKNDPAHRNQVLDALRSIYISNTSG